MTFDILKVTEIAKRAGAEIMAMRDAVTGKAQYKGDGSPVTEADKRASDIVMNELALLTPHIPVISEEAPEAQNRAIQQSSDTYWIVDPLDGTRSYIDGFDGFGVHIGLIEKGQPKAAAIYFPAQGILYYTDGVNGAFIQEDGKPARKISVTAPLKDGDAPVIAVSWANRMKVLQQHMDHTQIQAVGGDRVCQTAAGHTDLGLIEIRFSYWDIAAAHALLRQARGELYNLQTGVPITYPNDKLFIEPAIAGHPDTVEKFRETLKTKMQHLPAPVRTNRPPAP